MARMLLASIQSETLKLKRSAAAWLVIIGALFIPLMMLIIQVVGLSKNPEYQSGPKFWQELFAKSWESMSIFLLPVGIVLVTSLIGQLEYRNNTWKQIHTTPQRLSTIFISKLLVILFLMIYFFLIFNLGIYLAGIVPGLFTGNKLPKEPYPAISFLKPNLNFLIACLPIIAIQYLMSLFFKNFLVSVGLGFACIVGSIFALSWSKGYIIPYTYCGGAYLRMLGEKQVFGKVNLELLSLVYFFVVVVTSYFLYISKKEKG